MWCETTLIKLTAINIVPINTCSPWNPVATKNVLPNTESAIVNGASMYSNACKYVKNPPNITVITSPTIVPFLSPAIMAWCAYVAVAPDVNSTIVFNNGTWNASNVSIPIGGHTPPISTVGANDEWKNAQKNAKKNITSDVINNNIPYLNPLCTTIVWCPWYVASLITSLHHTIIVAITITNPSIITASPYLYECM